MRQALNYLRSCRYLLLLGALFALLVIEPIATSFGVMESLFNALLVIVMAVLVFALAKEKVWRVISVLLFAPAAILSISSHFLAETAHGVSLSISHGIGALFFFIVTLKLLRSIFASHELSLDSLFGAICGFLLLGTAWALTYSMIYLANPASFHVDDSTRPQLEHANYRQYTFTYYSFVTLTTVGYGDVTPISIPARTLSWVEAVTGQLYLAILIAGLISALVATKADADVARDATISRCDDATSQ
jgi:voltage-gated potassium channel